AHGREGPEAEATDAPTYLNERSSKCTVAADECAHRHGGRDTGTDRRERPAAVLRARDGGGQRPGARRRGRGDGAGPLLPLRIQGRADPRRVPVARTRPQRRG